MESLETTCEDSERAVKKKKMCRSSVPLFRPQEAVADVGECSTSKQPFCIFTKLAEIHKEESAAEPNQTKSGLKTSSHLLEKLVARERLNTLVLNLHPGNKGYSLDIPLSARTDQNADNIETIETVQWPYEDDKLLRYIDNEELPPHLSKTLDNFSYLFYSGCVIVEVRDYRQAYPHFMCDIHHVLLRPTLASILADINNIVEDKDWTNEERQFLESQILLANSPDLCLDPDPKVSDDVFQINHNSRMWNTHKFRRTARKYSQVTVNRKRKLDQFTHRHGLELYDYLTRVRTKPKVGTSTSLASKIPKKVTEEAKPISVPNLDPPILSPPSQGVVINEFKPFQRPKETSNCLPQLLEEYVLETDMPSKDKGKPRVYHIKLSILQRPSNLEYLGELYLDRDHKKNEKNGVACRFSLGTKAHAQKYVQQFTEIFTESGRKSVRIRYGVTPGYNKGIAVGQAQAQAQVQAQSASQQNTQFQVSQYAHNVQNQTCTAPQVNGTVGPGISLVQQQNQNVQNTTSVPILQSHLQRVPQIKSPTPANLTQQLEIDAIAANLMNSVQKFQADENAKQQQKQQQQLASSGSNAAIINLLNSSPASSVNSDASAAVVNAINNSSLLSQQVQTLNQKLIGRKMTLSNVANARVLNHSNIIAVNNNRINLSDLNTQLGQQQAQTITLTSVNTSGNYTNYTTVPVKQQVVNQRIVNNSSEASKSALSALLVGTPAADRPDIVGPNTNSLLLEKLAGSSNSSQNTQRQQPTAHFIQSPKAAQQYMVQSPKSNTVMSPLSSPPPQSTNTINVQSLNFSQLQSIPGLQNVQVQLPGFAQPISLSLNVSSTANIQGHPASLIVSLPVTTATATSNTVTQTAGSSGNAGNTISVGTPTVVLANAGTSNLAQLVTSGMKGIAQQSIRATGPASVTLSQGGQPFQLLTPLQRPRLQQAGVQQNITARTLQRTPITIKMAAPNANAATLPTASTLTSQLQKQAQLQQYQQLCLTQQNIASVASKVRRRSNNSDPQ